MTDFQDAKAELESSITGNRNFLKDQDVQATLNTTLSAVRAIRKAAVEWARAVVALKTMDANTEAQAQAVLQDPVVVELRQLVTKFAGDINEVENGILQLAEKADTLPA